MSESERLGAIARWLQREDEELLYTPDGVEPLGSEADFARQYDMCTFAGLDDEALLAYGGGTGVCAPGGFSNASPHMPYPAAETEEAPPVGVHGPSVRTSPAHRAIAALYALVHAMPREGLPGVETDPVLAPPVMRSLQAMVEAGIAARAAQAERLLALAGVGVDYPPAWPEGSPVQVTLARTRQPFLHGTLPPFRGLWPGERLAACRTDYPATRCPCGVYRVVWE